MTGLLGGSPPIAEAYIADVTSKEERPKFLAMMGAVISLSFLFGPGIGAGLAGMASTSGNEDFGADFISVLFCGPRWNLGVLFCCFMHQPLSPPPSPPPFCDLC